MININEGFVPAFYRSEATASLPLSRDTLREQYHCFTFKRNVRLVSVKVK